MNHDLTDQYTLLTRTLFTPRPPTQSFYLFKLLFTSIFNKQYTYKSKMEHTLDNRLVKHLVIYPTPKIDLLKRDKAVMKEHCSKML